MLLTEDNRVEFERLVGWTNNVHHAELIRQTSLIYRRLQDWADDFEQVTIATRDGNYILLNIKRTRQKVRLMGDIYIHVTSKQWDATLVSTWGVPITLGEVMSLAEAEVLERYEL